MSADINEVLAKVRDFSVSELLTLQETITLELRRKTETASPPKNGNGKLASPNNREVDIPGAHRFTTQEIEEELAEIFTAEELAELDGVDLSSLPTGSRTVTEILNEEREDRL